MNPDRAAELLQIPERGLDLLTRFEEEGPIAKAIRAVQAGFAPADVAAMYSLSYDATVLQDEEVSDDDVREGKLFVYECQTKRCKQKGRVATSSISPEDEEHDKPTCPSCSVPMIFLMAAEDEADINHLRRTYLPRARIADPLGRTDQGRDRGGEGDEDD